MQKISNFPILCGAWDTNSNSLVCGGGGGNVSSGGNSNGTGGKTGHAAISFLGTPVYVIGSLFPDAVI